jgi:hypothetical protein
MSDFDFSSIGRGNSATGTLPTSAQCVPPTERNEYYDSLAVMACELALLDYQRERPSTWSTENDGFICVAHLRLKYNPKTGMYTVDHTVGKFHDGYRGGMQVVREWYQTSGSVYWEASPDAPGHSPKSPMLNYVSRLDALRGAIECQFNKMGDEYREGKLDAPCFGGMTSKAGRDKLNRAGSRLKENLGK